MQDFSPFAEERANEIFHLLLQVGADTKLVFENDLAKVFDSSFHVLNPSCCPLQLVSRADVEAQVTVKDCDNVVWWHILGQQFAMTGLCTSVAADKDVEALLGGNKTEVLVLSLGALTHAAGYTSLELVWATDTLVTLLEANSHANTVTDTETAPCSSNTRLDRS